MFTSLSALSGKAILAWSTILLGIDLVLSPSVNLFMIMWVAIGIDLITGITKAKLLKVARTSDGFRKTVIKVAQYVVPVLIIGFIAMRIPEQKAGVEGNPYFSKAFLLKATGWLMMFIIYIEVTSIFENLYEIDKKTVIAKFIYKPALTLLKFGIEKNPVNAAADKLQQEQKDGKDTLPDPPNAQQ